MGGTSGRVLRGLAHRGPATALLVLIAVVAAAVAAAAPAYNAAARISIVSSTLDAAPAGTTQLDVQEPSGATKTAAALGVSVREALAASIGQKRASRLFAAPVVADETALMVGETLLPLVARPGVCGHLHVATGRCPAAPGEALESLQDNKFGPSPVELRAKGIDVVGTYEPADATDPWWFDRFSAYFPSDKSNALFVTEDTLAAHGGGGTLVADVGLASTRLTSSELTAALRAYDGVIANESLERDGANSATTLSSVIAPVHSGWRSLAVPTFVATGSLLVLSWLLLFTVVTEDVETRGQEIALARLRGLPRRRVLAAGVAEPLTVLVASIPIGAVVGWLAARALAHRLLGTAIPVGLPALSWGAAALAVLGGIAAVCAASWQVFARGVLELRRPAQREGRRRGWVFDAVLVTAAVAGLIELAVSGNVSSSSSGVQVELVPALLALAVAVVFSRLLPQLCRAAAARTRRHGGLGVFLAVRQVGRRPGGARSVMVLASAVAIALFAVSAWSVGNDARARVAAVTVGAPTVLTVSVPVGTDLGQAVDRVDPGGRRAVAVSSYLISPSQTLLAVDPSRFAAVALWAPGTPVKTVDTRLAPPVQPPAVVNGDAIRFRLSGKGLAQLEIYATVVSSASAAPMPIELTPSPGGFYVGTLADCPCTLDELGISGPREVPVSGAVTIGAVDVHGPDGWQDAGRAALQNWQTPPPNGAGSEALQHQSSSLVWEYTTVADGLAVIESSDRPDPLPAVVARDTGLAQGQYTNSLGVNGQSLGVLPLAESSSIPGAPATGIVVDRTYALRAAGSFDQGDQQVWLAPGAGALIAKLRAAHVSVLRTQTAAGLRTQLNRSGPGLATALLVFDAAVAAALAAVGALVSLASAARRRRYEYAALIAAGAGRRLIWRSLVLEQAVVLGYGLVIGLGAGFAGIAQALSRVPVLIIAPAAPALDLSPRAVPIAVAVLIAVAAIVVTAAISSAALVRSVRASALREGAA